MKLRINKNEGGLSINEVVVDKDGNETLTDFDYLKYINQYIDGLRIDFDFTDDIDNDTKSKINNLDQEIFSLVTQLKDS